MELGTLRGYGRCMGLKVVESCSQGHFLFTYSDTFAAKCIVYSHNRQTTVSCQLPITLGAAVRSVKNRTAEISTSGIARIVLVTCPCLFQTWHFQRFGSEAIRTSYAVRSAFLETDTLLAIIAIISTNQLS